MHETEAWGVNTFATYMQLNDDGFEAPTFTSIIQVAVPLLFPGFLDSWT